MRIAVAGGTGTMGRHAVEAARARGHEVVVLSRSNGVDLVTGRGLGDALRGVDVVIDASNLTSTSTKKVTAFFTGVTRNLLAAEERAGVRHHVTPSIVGVDRAPYGYYAAKVAQAVARLGIRYPVLVDDEYAYWRALGNQYWPAFYLIDPEGRIVDVRVGELHAGDRRADRFEAAIARLSGVVR